MRFRPIAIRIVLVLAALATVATSAPRGDSIDDFDLSDLTGPVTVRAFGRLDPRAFEFADRFYIHVDLSAETGQVMLIPDDPSQPVVDVELTPERSYYSHWVEADDISCPRNPGAGCELGISIDVPEGVTVSVQVVAQAIRDGDPSFFFPENRDFPDDAVVEAGFDE